MVVVDGVGKRIGGTKNPASETPILTSVFRARPDAMAVFHLHLDYATLFSIVGKPLQLVGVIGAPFGKDVPVRPDPILIKRPEHGAGMARTLGDRAAVILRGHGAVIIGRSLEEAFAASVMLEDNALRPFREMQIDTPQEIDGEELVDNVRPMWQPQVVDKMWTF